MDLKNTLRKFVDRCNVSGISQTSDARLGDSEEVKLQIGSIQSLLAKHFATNLKDSQFKVFSQFGEDGILQFLIRQFDDIPESFVEFGVQDYREANTRFLLQNNNWRGLIIDGCDKWINDVKDEKIYWRHDLTAISAFIDRDNINTIISGSEFVGPIGILSIDIDGNDYWVWEAIDIIDPSIVVCEYNSVFGKNRSVSIPYAPKFVRNEAHHSNLYWGCSIGALVHLGVRKGYDFVGCNSACNNAFFVKQNKTRLKNVSVEEGFVESRFRESRDQDGKLTFLSGHRKLREIAECPLIDVNTGEKLICEQLITND